MVWMAKIGGALLSVATATHHMIGDGYVIEVRHPLFGPMEDYFNDPLLGQRRRRERLDRTNSPDGLNWREHARVNFKASDEDLDHFVEDFPADVIIAGVLAGIARAESLGREQDDFVPLRFSGVEGEGETYPDLVEEPDCVRVLFVNIPAAHIQYA